MATQQYQHTCLLVVLFGGMLSSSAVTQAEDLYSAFSQGKAYGDVNLRFESVDQDNALKDADALTLRTRLGYRSGSLNGFSFQLEMEDSRIVLGQGDYASPPNDYNSGIYSVIADPEHTELDQGFVQYQSEQFNLKLGRQVITHDGHRFIGHVGWRQDRQTFDGATFNYTPNKQLSLSYSYISQRNRIFAQDADLDANDHLLHASYKTAIGTVSAYSYLLEVDNGLANGLDTYGVRLAGQAPYRDMQFSYQLEYAQQTNESTQQQYESDYVFIELGAQFGSMQAKIGYELLGSDNGLSGFQTPLATLHKFNGWSDQFLMTPNEGLQDITFTLSGKLAGGKWLAAYHDFSADVSSEQVDDLGDEINLQYVKTFGEHYKVGVKYASYSGSSGKVDTDKLWLWLNVGF